LIPGEPPVELPSELPVVPLRNAVQFPGSLIPLDIGRERSLVAVDRAVAAGGLVAGVTQVDQRDDGPEMKLYEVGCAMRIHKTIRLAKDNLAVIVQGLQRIRILAIDRSGECFVARVEAIAEPDGGADDLVMRKAAILKEEAKRLIARMPELPKEASGLVDSLVAPSQIADVLVSHLDLSVEEKQRVLETIALAPRLDLVLEHIRRATGS